MLRDRWLPAAITFREAQYLVVYTCRFASIKHFLIGRSQLSIANIVHDGVIEHDRALRNNSDLRT